VWAAPAFLIFFRSMAQHLAAVLLVTPRLESQGGWIRVGIPPVANADRVIRAAADHLSSLVGHRVTMCCGGFQCERPKATRRWLRRHSARVIREAFPDEPIARAPKVRRFLKQICKTLQHAPAERTIHEPHYASLEERLGLDPQRAGV
jgi:hypothetical protein